MERHKNPKSLRTHRYSYHRKRKSELEENRPKPQLKRIPTSPSIDSMSIHSNEEFDDNFHEFEIDDIQSRLIDVEMDTMKIKTDIKSLQSFVDELKTITKKLEKDINDKFYLKAYHPENKPISTLGHVQTWLVVLFHCQNGQFSHFYNKSINNYSMVLKLSEMIIIVITNGLRSSAMNNIVKWPSYVEKCNIWLHFSMVQPIINF